MASQSDFSSFFSTSSRRCVWVNGPVIIGAGPAGLAVAAGLQTQNVPYVILDRADCVASLWQHRTYDRLKLHLPKQFCQLPNYPFPADYPEYPSKAQFVAYMESYTANFGIRPQFNESVQSARFDSAIGLWRVRTSQAASTGAGEVEYICQWVVVATGENAERVIPDIDGMKEFDGPVVHAADYKSGEPFRGKKVVVVGCGNSGMEVCLDLCHHGAFPSMVVRDSVHVLPREMLGKSTYELAFLLMRWLPLWLVDKVLVFLAWLVLGRTEKYGLSRPSVGPLELKKREGKTPVLDIGALEKIRSGEVEVVPGVRRFMAGGAELIDGRLLDADAVVFATGYRSNVPYWLQGTDFFSKNGFPRKPFPNGWKGENGLYAAGFTRNGLAGVSKDAVRIAEDITKAWKEGTRQVRKQTSCHRRCISQF